MVGHFGLWRAGATFDMLLIVRQHAENRPLKKPARDERARAREIRGLHASLAREHGEGQGPSGWCGHPLLQRHAGRLQRRCSWPRRYARDRPPRASSRSGRVAAHLELKSCKRSVEALPCNERMREVMQGFTRVENSFPTDLLKTSTDEGTSSIVPHPLRRLSPPLLASIALSLYVVYVVTELEPLGQTDIDGTDYMYLLFNVLQGQRITCICFSCTLARHLH